jgi:hypothetical protein
MLRFHIQNVLGVMEAKVDVEGIVLVAGAPGSGKSSILDACASAAAGTLKIRTVRDKLERQKVKHHASHYHGRISMVAKTGQRLLTYRTWQVTDRGTPPTFDPLVTGADVFSRVAERARFLGLRRRFPHNPTLDDMVQALGNFECENPDYAAQLLHLCLAHDGWNITERAVLADFAKTKARWRAITGTAMDRSRWLWRKDGVDPDNLPPLADLHTAAENARSEMDDAKRRADLTVEQLEEMKRQVARLEWQHELLGAYDADLKVLRQARQLALDEIQERANRLTEPGSAPCPCCGEELWMVRGIRRPSLAKVDSLPKLTSSQRDHLQLQVDRREEHIRKIDAENERLLAERAAVEEKIAAGQTADGIMAQMGTLDGIGDVELYEMAKAVHDAAAARYQAHIDWAESRQLLRQRRNLLQVYKAVRPAGARLIAADRAFAELNSTIKELCSMSRLPLVHVHGDGRMSIAGVDFTIASETQRWIADTMVRLALAMHDGATFTTIPSFHLLAPNDRPAFFQMLKSIRLDCLIELMTKDKDTVPRIDRAGLGRIIWMEDGAVTAPFS